MPRQSKSQTIGHKGERWFADQLPAKWIPQFPSTDIGVDALVVICEDGPVNGLEFRVQVKSTHRWQVQNGCILLRGFRTSALHDLVLGFTPALLVLYEAESDTGHCYWLNQLFAQDLDLLNGLRKTVTLKVPMVRPINASLWPQLAAEVRGLASALGRRIAVSGISLPILEATHTLMQSLHLIDLCANGSGAVIPLNELFNAELTAHKEIVTALVNSTATSRSYRVPFTA